MATGRCRPAPLLTSPTASIRSCSTSTSRSACSSSTRSARSVTSTGAAWPSPATRRDDIVGRSIVEFVEPDDLEFLIASLAFAEHYDDAVMGPSRVRFRHRDGETRWTEYWAYECPASFGFSGYIVTMSPESVTDNLANAAYQIASDQPLATCLTSLARAVTSYPLVATGTMMVRSDRLGDTDAIATGGDAAFTLIGHWPPCRAPPRARPVAAVARRVPRRRAARHRRRRPARAGALRGRRRRVPLDLDAAGDHPPVHGRRRRSSRGGTSPVTPARTRSGTSTRSSASPASRSTTTSTAASSSSPPPPTR